MKSANLWELILIGGDFDQWGFCVKDRKIIEVTEGPIPHLGIFDGSTHSLDKKEQFPEVRGNSRHYVTRAFSRSTLNEIRSVWMPKWSILLLSADLIHAGLGCKTGRRLMSFGVFTLHNKYDPNFQARPWDIYYILKQLQCKRGAYATDFICELLLQWTDRFPLTYYQDEYGKLRVEVRQRLESYRIEYIKNQNK
jgi:hypothetical protein